MSSRLVVKGLPGNASEARLRSVFGEFGSITDCALKYTKEGKFRRFAFVGFDNEVDASRAVAQLNGTFIDSSRIVVEVCKAFGDETKPRAWSKYAKGSSAYKRAHPEEEKSPLASVTAEEKGKKKPKVDDGDTEFEEFLQLQKPGTLKSQQVLSEGVFGGNGDDLLGELLKGISGDTSMSLILRALPCNIKPKSVKEWLSPIRVKGVKVVRNDTEAAAFVTFSLRGDVQKVLKRSGQFLGGYKVQVRQVSGNETDAINKDSGNKEDNLYEDKETEERSLTNAILETGRLFLRNLPFSSTEDDLLFLLKKFGEVAEVEVIIDKKTNQCKGYAIATFVFPENAVAAYSALDGSIFKGRMLHVLPGEEKREKPAESGLSKKSAFQAARFAKLKADAGKAHSWNALFLGANAVADTLAAKLSTQKSDLLSSEGEISAGVRLALAETRLVRETRDFLVSNGVCLDAFSRPAAKRSDLVIIVKNLPANVESDEVRRLFERFGPVKRFLHPPEAISAIVEMGNSVDARNAFSSLAYARFRSQPLYLEWAPVDIFIFHGKEDGAASDATGELERKEETASGGKKVVELSKEEKRLLRRSKKHRISIEKVENESKDEPKAAPEDITPKGEDKGVDEEVSEEVKELEGEEEMEEDEEKLEPGTTVFVKNLSFDTTDEALANAFSSQLKLRSAVISKKRDTKDPSKTLSMGFGFVQFYRASDAEKAIKDMQGLVLDGHCLELKLSHRENVVDESRKRKSVGKLKQGKSTKILVRNIPFQASHKEVKELFSTFGELRAFRLPKKMGSSTEGHRGFGFVDFLTCADARRAFEALVHSTHLYGRRLVLEWAKREETVEELREKTLSSYRSETKEVRKPKQRMKLIEKDLATLDDD